MAKHTSRVADSPTIASWFARLADSRSKHKSNRNNGDRRIHRSSARILLYALVITLFAVTFAYTTAWGREMERLEAISSADVFKEFDLKTLEGDHFTNENLKDTKLTLFNVWGTECGPCIMEMPELEELSHSYPGEVQVVGICNDAVDSHAQPVQSKIKEAQAIMDKTGATFPTLVLDEKTYAFITSNIAGTPTTFYVNQNGEILRTVAGRQSLKEMKATVDEELFKLK